ncbi:MAG: YjjG family noncanonical pyrimidine nucleotidase [Bacteroidetes bacterium]|nr:YjjG family noncanonical pyrimidine nucleotidase [Bacteroidota bacterium]
MYKYLFFDLDHTLWDFEKNAAASLKDLHSKHDLNRHQITDTDFVSKYTEINHALWRLYHKGEIDKEFLRTQRFIKTFEYFNVPTDQIPLNLWDEYLELLPFRTHLMAGCIELMEYLNPKYKMTIITNGFKEVQHKKMQNSKLLTYFDHLVISEDVGHQKPAKEIFEYAMQLNHCKPSEVLMIGDNVEADIQGANNAGIDSVFYNPSNLPDSVGATFEIKSLLELKRLV